MCCHLLQGENVDYHSVKYITSLCKELVKAPALLLISFKDVGKDWGKQCLETPKTVFTKLPGRARAQSHNSYKEHKSKELPVGE